MTSVTRDENREGEAMGATVFKGKWGRSRDSSTVLEANDTTKSGVVAREDEGGN
jgi:hypothetical protein